jgi:tryptophan 2,3-dioxygenase
MSNNIPEAGFDDVLSAADRVRSVAVSTAKGDEVREVCQEYVDVRDRYCRSAGFDSVKYGTSEDIASANQLSRRVLSPFANLIQDFKG